MMMEINEIIEVLQAFKEGKRVVRSIDSNGKKDCSSAAHGAGDLIWLVNEIGAGAHFEVAREPKSVWLARIGNYVMVDYHHFDSAKACDDKWQADLQYKGAVEFREVLP